MLYVTQLLILINILRNTPRISPLLTLTLYRLFYRFPPLSTFTSFFCTSLYPFSSLSQVFSLYFFFYASFSSFFLHFRSHALDAPALPVRSLISTVNPQFSYGVENGDLVSDSETDSDEGEKEVEKEVEKGVERENGKEVEVERKVEKVEKEVEKGVEEKVERGVGEEVIRYEKSMMSENRRKGVKEDEWEYEKKLNKSSEKEENRREVIVELKEEKEDEDEKETEGGDERDNIISELIEKVKDTSNSNVKILGKKSLKIKKIIPESPVQGPWKSAESRTNSANSSTEFISSIYDNSLLSPPRHPSLPRSLPQSPPLSLSQSLSFPTSSLLPFTPNMFDSPPMKSVKSSEFCFNGNDISRNIDTENDDFDEFSQFLDKSKNDNDEKEEEEGEKEVNDKVYDIEEDDGNDGEIFYKKGKERNGQKGGERKQEKEEISDEKGERSEEKEGKESKEGRERRESREGAVDGMTECLVMLQKKLKQLQKR